PTPILSGGFNVGDGNMDNRLDPGEVWHYSASVTEPQTLCTTINGQQVVAGTLSTVDMGSSIKFIYRQNTALVDNTYGNTASPDWLSGHKFSDLTGSDHVEFRFKNGAGTTVLDFSLDY